MNSKHINRYLVASVLIMSIIPLVSSYVLVGEVLDGSLGLINTAEVKHILEDYRTDLKRLGRQFPEASGQYREKFDKVNDALFIQNNADMLHKVLKDTYTAYYLILFAITLFLSTFIAILLSKKVSSTYKTLAEQDVQKSRKIQELVYFDEWQTIAGRLAHELKNPLMPIEMMINNLLTLHQKAGQAEFTQYLEKTHAGIREEIRKLREMIMHFARFSRVPRPHFEKCDIAGYITGFVEKHRTTWSDAILKIETQGVEKVFCLIDPHLFDQCLYNLYNNAVEANPDFHLQITACLSVTDDNKISMVIKDNGKGVDNNTREDIFKMYYTTRSHGENMGLGLPIAKKIVLDHSGSIYCREGRNGAEFEIKLPLAE